MLLRLPILFSLCLALAPLLGQGALQALYSKAEYEQCLQQSETLLEANAQDSSALFFRGLCLIKAGNYQDAHTSLVAAEAANFPAPALCKAQQALCLTQLQQKEAAVEILQTLVDGGFSNYTIIDQKEFSRLANMPAFKAVRDSVHRRSFPCYYDPNYTHFDFWVGEWDVFVGETKVGENQITKQDGGCAVLEQYTTARDYVGQSYNYYDPADGLWKQIWIDHTRGISNYVESERKPGYLQFISTDKSHPAGYANLRMTFTLNDDGSVRQHMEQQNAEEVWQTVFDGRYVRKPEDQ